jgi:hypothetical protein
VLCFHALFFSSIDASEHLERGSPFSPAHS